MDIEMITTTDEDTKENLWDFKVKNGKLCWIDYTAATQQRSIIATYLQRGTIPQLPDVGNQWVEFLTRTVAPNELNTQIRNSIMDMTGELSYLPKYNEVDGKLIVEVSALNG